MDMWLYYQVTHGLHTIYNPVAPQTLEDHGRLLELTPNSRILDMACGEAWQLLTLLRGSGCRGVGVDSWNYVLERARDRAADWDMSDRVEFLEMDGKDYGTSQPFDATICIGASWIWDGYVPTLQALADYTKPGSLVMIGQPYWLAEPHPDYLAAEELVADVFPTGLDDLVRRGEALGLSLVYLTGNDPLSWDRYEMLQMASLDRFRRANPDHPDLPAIAEKRAMHTDAYLRWGRDCCGFAVATFRT